MFKNSIMGFLKSLYNSLCNFSWLKQQRKAGGVAWAYFVKFLLLVVLVGLIPVGALLPGAYKEARSRVQRLPTFEAQLKSGSLTVTGLAQPFVSREDGSVFVLDTVNTSTPPLESYFDKTITSGILVTRDRIEAVDKAGKEQVIDLKSAPDYTINNEKIGKFVSSIGPGIMVAIVVIAAVAFFIGIFIAKLWSILIAAWVAWLVSRITNRSWKFGELVSVGLFAVTLPTIISLVFAAVNIRIPFLHFLALVAFMIAMVITNDGEAAKIDAPTDSV